MKSKTLKVCNFAQGKKSTIGLNIKGEYLKDLGFEVGDMVSVKLTACKIVISKEKTI